LKKNLKLQFNGWTLSLPCLASVEVLVRQLADFLYVFV